MHYLTVYSLIAGANSLFSLLRAFLFAWGGVCAARTIHNKLIRAVLRARTVFFDTTPAGRILNRLGQIKEEKMAALYCFRFSSDLGTVDDSLPFILNIFLANLLGVLGPLVVTVYALPWFCLVLVPLCLLYWRVQARYRPASRDLKRLSSVSLSPIYSHFSETLAGLSTIRALR